MRILPIAIALLLPGCGQVETERAKKLVLRGEAMGTGWSVILSDGSNAPEGLRDQVVASIGSVESAMSTWIEDSEVSRFNRLPKGEAVALSEGTLKVVACALDVWRESGGKFDITIGSAADGGSENLALDLENGTLTKMRDGALIDLSAIAKGYAVDAVAEALDRAGIESYLVEIGGELRGKGTRSDGVAWTVGVERPDLGGGRIAGKVDLSGMSVATSGNYRQRRHLIEPSTGEAVDGAPMAVCVLHESAMVADAWATALFVAGVEEGIRLADELGLAVAYVVDRGKDLEPEVTTSKGFRWKEDR